MNYHVNRKTNKQTNLVTMQKTICLLLTLILTDFLFAYTTDRMILHMCTKALTVLFNIESLNV